MSRDAVRDAHGDEWGSEIPRLTPSFPPRPDFPQTQNHLNHKLCIYREPDSLFFVCVCVCVTVLLLCRLIYSRPELRDMLYSSLWTVLMRCGQKYLGGGGGGDCAPLALTTASYFNLHIYISTSSAC